MQTGYLLVSSRRRSGSYRSWRPVSSIAAIHPKSKALFETLSSRSTSVRFGLPRPLPPRDAEECRGDERDGAENDQVDRGTCWGGAFPVERDFLLSVPEADLFILKNVLHDCDDER
jgi:hypothetical protein